jgi:hypothetical protein
MTIADDVAMLVQRGLVLHASARMIHVAHAISGSECALVIQHIDGKQRRRRWSWGVQYSGGCGLCAFDTKSPPFRWVARPSAPGSTDPRLLSDGTIGVCVLKIFFPALTWVREDQPSCLCCHA